MKIFTTKFSQLLNNTKNKAQVFKTEPYPADCFQKSSNLCSKKTLLQKILNVFNVRTKLNPKYFADGSHTPKVEFLKSKQATDISKEYLKSNCLLENEKIIDGFRDAGGGAQLDYYGNVIWAKREIITVDREHDVYLRNAINYVKENTTNMSEKEKMKFIYNVVHDISGNAEKALEYSELMSKHSAGRELLLGKIFEHGATVCRHKALMVKILADEIGLKARVLRGNSFDLSGYGRHVWNEIKLSNGKKILIDVQNSKIIEVSKSGKNPKLAGYCTENNHPIYHKY